MHKLTKYFCRCYRISMKNALGAGVGFMLGSGANTCSALAFKCFNLLRWQYTFDSFQNPVFLDKIPTVSGRVERITLLFLSLAFIYSIHPRLSTFLYKAYSKALATNSTFKALRGSTSNSVIIVKSGICNLF